MKKIISLVLSLLLVFSVFSVSSVAFAQEETLIEARNFTAKFENDKGLLTIDGKDALYFFTEPSFADLSDSLPTFNLGDVKKVIIRDGITVIDRDTFEGMNKLEEITIPESLVKINANAFKNCQKIKRINYGGSEDEWKEVNVNTRGNSIFLKAKVTYSVDVPESEGDYETTFDVLETDDALYYFKTAELKIKADGYIEQDRIVNNWFGAGEAIDYKPICVEKLVIYDGVIKLGSDMMASCDSLEYVAIPDSVVTIEKDCFYGCRNISTVFYEGSKDEWKKVFVEKEGNEDLLDANMQYGEEEVVSTTPILIALIVLFALSAMLVVLATRKRKE